MSIEACIFDLDGVIVDSAKYHYEAWKTLAQSLGIDFSEDENENLKGVSRMESLDYILNLGGIEKSIDEKQHLAKAKNDHYLQLIENMSESEILPGVQEFLIELQESNIKIGLGSSSKNAELILKKLNLHHFFEVIIDGTKTSQSKPHPQVFEMGSKQLNVLPQNSLVFEDARKGIEAAKNGGFKCIGVGEWLHLNTADYVIPGFANFKLKDLANIY